MILFPYWLFPCMAKDKKETKISTLTSSDDISDDLSSEDLERVCENALPWSQIYALAHTQDAELVWAITDYTPSLEQHQEQAVTKATGIIRAGQIAAIVGAVGSAADGMAHVFSGRAKGYRGVVKRKPSSTTFIDDIRDFKYTLPSQLTVSEAVHFYMGICMPPGSGDIFDFELAGEDCMREFDLFDMQDVKCAYLNPTHSKLLYVLSMLLNPLPILILHNPERYLDDEHCFVIAKRLIALAAGGHSVLICSTQVAEVFLDACTYIHVFHQSGIVMYGGPPKGFPAFLLSQGLQVNMYSSISEVIFRASSLDLAALRKLECIIDKPPVPPALETRPPILQGTSPTFFLHLKRTAYILIRDQSLLFAREVTGVVFAMYCFAVLEIRRDDALSDVYTVVILDIYLTLVAAAGLAFGYLESRSVDVFLIEESRSLGRFSHPGVILAVRLITKLVLELISNTLLGLIGLAICNAFSVLSVTACLLLLPACALLYSFFGAFCALFKKLSGIFMPLMFLVFMWSIMLALTPMFEIKTGASTVWRITSPLYIVKALMLTYSAPTYGSAKLPIDKLEGVNTFLTVMDFKLKNQTYVTGSIGVLVSLLVMTIASYFICLRLLLKRN
ncbi:ATP-binding cassette sub-family G member 1 isoform X2 [Tropilaelaps mercedesae]|uniref:ATP-binding cassette sub-family G member 1 isoform X2 n=1 Tax=Tropilaelaps mercedesae TaxID=418985 RepID=A0A1V9XU22_9ACAR|nr:ATP-binding cassette sub-family G member 1 isoform X2 [Tropilaelaps mercedesae]